jgi:hypothetical protein
MYDAGKTVAAITRELRLTRKIVDKSENSAPTPAPAAWLESLARSKMKIAAGEGVPLLPVLDRLRASAERLEAEQGVTAGAKVTASR